MTREEAYVILGIDSYNHIEKSKSKLGDGRWVTIDGRHVFIGSDGSVKAGVVYKEGEGRISSNDEKKIEPIRLEDKFAMGNYFNLYNEEIESKVNKNQINSLEKYRDLRYFQLNRQLRQGEDVSGDRDVKNLDGAISKVETKHDLSLYRGLDKNGKEFFNSLKVGEVFTDPAYSSTTLNKDAIESFKEGSGGYEIEIVARKGSKAMPMQNIGEEGIYDEEFEFLLPRSSNFKVLEKKGNTVKVELL